MSRLLILTSYDGGTLEAIRDVFAGQADVEVVRTLRELERAPIDPGTSLMSFGTGVIVPAELLMRLERPAYNLHPGTPEFPGRDPHHHAIYRGATHFGATLHGMTARVDDGPIVAVERFEIASTDGPLDLMEKATRAGVRLLRRMGRAITSPDPLPPLAGEAWGATKTRRSDMVELCRLPADITSIELERRIRAFDVAGHDNIKLVIHGREFVLSRPAR